MRATRTQPAEEETRPLEGRDGGMAKVGFEVSPEGRRSFFSSPVVRHLVQVSQVGLVLLAMHRFWIEDGFGFRRIIPLIFAGFLVHLLLPIRHRRAFFVLLSLAAIGVVLPFPHSLLLVATGLALIGICHLPIALAARVGLLLAVAAGLVGIRAGWVSTSGWTEYPTLILPVLGAIFMFRLAIYLYDLRHEKVPASLWERLSYFFLLPNVCFLLFPVVDYRTFRRTYYNTDEHAIYEKGILWMMRGTIHLLLYRLVYQYLVPAPQDVHGLGTVLLFMVTSYLLYLRISGQFHLIIGVLCLFGFNLPETHHLYYFATSFNDFWRRINIYWKDFMMKMVYYPAFMRFRRFGMAPGIVLATVVVFLGTWLLHSYQWFWLQGAFPLTATDGLFWGFLGVLVVANSLAELKRKKKRVLGSETWSFRHALTRSAKIVGMFSIMSILWSFWSSASIGEWWSVVSRASVASPAGLGLLALGVMAAVAVGVVVQFALRPVERPAALRRALTSVQPGYYAAAVAALLILVSLPQVRGRLGEQADAFVQSIRKDRLRLRDKDLAERGYYEGLLDTEKFTSALWAAQRGKPKGREWAPTRGSNVIRFTGDFLEYEIKPEYEGTYKDAPFATNRWGMRDRKYQLSKPPGTYRIALLGASYELAAGVELHQTFESVLEDRLNRGHSGEAYSNYEVLNMAVGGYGMVQKLMVAQDRIGPFDPDMVLLTVYSSEELRTITHLVNIVSSDIPIPYPYLRQLVERAGVTADMEVNEIRNRLEPFGSEIVDWTFRSFADVSRERGYLLVAAFIPAVKDKMDGANQDRFELLWDLAGRAGLQRVSLDDVYAGHDLSDVELAPWDQHLSVLGNELVGERLYSELRSGYPLMFGQASHPPAAEASGHTGQ